MRILPFNILYNGFLLNEISEELNQISELYAKYSDLLYNKDDFNIIPVVIYDIDDDNFGFKDAFGDEIKTIKSYSLDKKEFIDIELTTPLSKNDYQDIYNSDIIYIKIDKTLPYIFPLFKDKILYEVLDKKYSDRYYLILNIACGGKISPYDGVIDSVGSDNISIKDKSGDYHTIYLDTKYLLFKEGDNVNKGDLLNEYVTVNMNEGFNVYLKDPTKINIVRFLTRLNSKINLVI